MLKEIEQAGEERVKAMDERISKFADIDKRLAELMAVSESQPDQIEEDDKEQEEDEDP